MKRDPGDREIYRGLCAAGDLIEFRIVVKETDLMVLARMDLSREARDLVLTHRDRLEHWIGAHPGFRESLAPVDVPPAAPGIVRAMAGAGAAAGVGPMAAVAGAIAEAVGAGLLGRSPDVIVENGGDLWLATTRERTVGLYTGDGRIDGSLGIRVAPERAPIGICTSSGRIGHSLSFGDAASATVIAASGALADAAATAVGNRVRGPDGIREGLRAAASISGVLGAVVTREGELGAWGDVELVPLAGGAP